MNVITMIGIVTAMLTASFAMAAGPLEGGVDPKRIAAIAAELPEGTFGFGPKIGDRAGWETLAANPVFANVVANTEKRLSKPVPEMTEDVFGLYAKTGERTKQYTDVRSARYNRITAYTLAEGIENKGRFIAPLEAAVSEVCADPTWVYNFHDTKDLANFHGKALIIDLGAVVPAHDLSQALYLLGDRLSPSTRSLIVATCRKRILDPYRAAVEGKSAPLWWITADMNWNAVCHAGVVGTALGITEDKQERAYFIAAAEKYSADYLRGFGSDGYCAEGMGYWNYGYGNFITMAENILQATGGKVDLFELPNARAAAMYPARLEILPAVSPAYADCGLYPKPNAYYAAFVNRRYQLGLKQYDLPDLSQVTGALADTLMYSTPNSATKTTARDKPAAFELRSYFDHGGVLTCRPAPGSDCVLGVSLKGGNNAEPHNHNDLGTFNVAVGKQLLILDPGGEVYNARTFSKRRYESNLLNSFGHPVPVIAGQLQHEGLESAAKIVKADFTDATDTFAMDLTSAYPVPALKNLTRTFTYSRAAQGALTVTDEFSFESPQSFATALITYGQWLQKDDHTLTITQADAGCQIVIDAPAFDIKAEEINEHTHDGKKPTRIGVNLKEPLTSGRVMMTITPIANMK